MTNQEAINSLATDMLEKGKEVAALRETINRLYAERDNALDELTLANAECSKLKKVLTVIQGLVTTRTYDGEATAKRMRDYATIALGS